MQLHLVPVRHTLHISIIREVVTAMRTYHQLAKALVDGACLGPLPPLGKAMPPEVPHRLGQGFQQPLLEGGIGMCPLNQPNHCGSVATVAVTCSNTQQCQCTDHIIKRKHACWLDSASHHQGTQVGYTGIGVAMLQGGAHAVNCEAKWKYAHEICLLATRIDESVTDYPNSTLKQTVTSVKLTCNAPAASNLMLPGRQLRQAIIHLLLDLLFLSRVLLAWQVGEDQGVHGYPVHDQQGILLLRYPPACSLDIGHGPRGSLTRL